MGLFQQMVERLVEVFDTTDFQILDTGFGSHPDTWKGKFSVDGREFSFKADQDSDGYWDLGFEDEYKRIGITGRGGQYKVFTALMKILELFVKEASPNKVAFTAIHPSRIRLYDKLVQWFSSKFGFEQVEGRSQGGVRYHWKTYYLQKIEAPEQGSSSFEEMLNEVLATKEFKILQPDRIPGRIFNVGFLIGDRLFNFESHKSSDYRGKEYWYVSFTDDENSFDVSGKGSQYQVIAAIVEILRQFESAEHPEEVRFSASHKSRVRVYNRLIKWFAEEFGYTEKLEPGWSSQNSKYYTLVRNKP